MKLNGETVYLKEISESDTKDIISWRNKDEVRKYFIYQDLFTEQSHLRWMEDYVSTGKAKQFIIVSKKDDQPIGSTYLRDIDEINKKAEFGIFIGEEGYLGSGYGTEALNLIVEYGFVELHLNKIFLRVFADNVRAIKSYEKAGFRQEGYFVRDVLVNGEYRDLVFMGKNRDV